MSEKIGGGLVWFGFGCFFIKNLNVRKKIGGGLGGFWEALFKLFFEKNKIGGGLGGFWEVFFKKILRKKKIGGGLGWFWEVLFKLFFENKEKLVMVLVMVF